MATIILDGQSKSWKVKATVDGKDKRVTLRKARQGEPRKPIPDDLVVLAASKGFKVETIPTRAAIPEGSPTTTTVGEIGGMIAAFLADYRQRSRPGSVIRMEGVLRDFGDYLATRPTLATIGEVTPDVVMDYFAWRCERIHPRLRRKVKPTYVIGSIELLSGMFKWACESGLIGNNPTKRPLYNLRKLHPRPDPADETKYLDPDQLRAFLQALEAAVQSGSIPLDYADLARVMVSTGLRVEAAVNLDWAWISRDWEVSIPPLPIRARPAIGRSSRPWGNRSCRDDGDCP